MQRSTEPFGLPLSTRERRSIPNVLTCTAVGMQGPTGLGVLLEYMTPQTRVDLYFLARKVREGEQGIAPSNMLDLPALS